MPSNPPSTGRRSLRIASREGLAGNDTATAAIDPFDMTDAQKVTVLARFNGAATAATVLVEGEMTSEGADRPVIASLSLSGDGDNADHAIVETGGLYVRTRMTASTLGGGTVDLFVIPSV